MLYKYIQVGNPRALSVRKKVLGNAFQFGEPHKVTKSEATIKHPRSVSLLNKMKSPDISEKITSFR